MNPGRLPIGVTPKNILHASRRRNDGLARIFHDLEADGARGQRHRPALRAPARRAVARLRPSRRDRLRSRRPSPAAWCSPASSDCSSRRTSATSSRSASASRSRSSRRPKGVSAAELAEELELPDTRRLRPWLGRLLTWGLVEQSGRTNATRYFVPPALLREAGLDALTTLTRVQPHRLRALILEDLERFPDSVAKGEFIGAWVRRFRSGPSAALWVSSSRPVRSRQPARNAGGSTVRWMLSAKEAAMADKRAGKSRRSPWNCAEIISATSQIGRDGTAKMAERPRGRAGNHTGHRFVPPAAFTDPTRSYEFASRASSNGTPRGRPRKETATGCGRNAVEAQHPPARARRHATSAAVVRGANSRARLEPRRARGSRASSSPPVLVAPNRCLANRGAARRRRERRRLRSGGA